MESDDNLRRLSAGDIERMVRAGVFGLDERIELLDGQLVEMTVRSRVHVATASRIARALQLGLPATIVRCGMPFELAPYDRPEPDIVVLPFRADFYRGGDAAPPAVHAIVEVGDASLGFDRGRKSAAYGRAGVREYWVVDAALETIEVRRRPGPDGRYADVRQCAIGEHVALADLPAVTFAVAALVGGGE